MKMKTLLGSQADAEAMPGLHVQLFRRLQVGRGRIEFVGNEAGKLVRRRSGSVTTPTVAHGVLIFASCSTVTLALGPFMSRGSSEVCMALGVNQILQGLTYYAIEPWLKDETKPPSSLELCCHNFRLFQRCIRWWRIDLQAAVAWQ